MSVDTNSNKLYQNKNNFITMKITKIISSGLFMILLVLSSVSYGQNTTLSGYLKGMPDKQVTVFYNMNGKSHIDTIKPVEGHFKWESTLEDEPIRMSLDAGAGNFFFFAEPGKLTLEGIWDSLATYQIKGSIMQEHEELYKESTRGLMQEWDTLYRKLGSASADEKIQIESRRQEISLQFIEKAHQFISEHTTSPYSLYLINIENDYPLIKRLYEMIDPTTKETPIGRNIAKRLEKMSKRQIGSQLENFTQPDTAGHLVSFQQFKGKYTLIDFWASWCMPCRAENPNVLNVYQLYKDKGFAVVGISLDDKASNWKKAIQDDKLPWTQLSTLTGWDNELSSRLGIEFIPSNVLVDPNGKIIATDLRGEMLKAKLAELFK